MFLSAYPTEKEIQQWYDELSPDQHKDLGALAVQTMQDAVNRYEGIVKPMYPYQIKN